MYSVYKYIYIYIKYAKNITVYFLYLSKLSIPNVITSKSYTLPKANNSPLKIMVSKAGISFSEGAPTFRSFVLN